VKNYTLFLGVTIGYSLRGVLTDTLGWNVGLSEWFVLMGISLYLFSLDL